MCARAPRPNARTSNTPTVADRLLLTRADLHALPLACARALPQLLGRNVNGERLRYLMAQDLRGERSANPITGWKELSSLGQIPFR